MPDPTSRVLARVMAESREMPGRGRKTRTLGRGRRGTTLADTRAGDVARGCGGTKDVGERPIKAGRNRRGKTPDGLENSRARGLGNALAIPRGESFDSVLCSGQMCGRWDAPEECLESVLGECSGSVVKCIGAPGKCLESDAGEMVGKCLGSALGDCLRSDAPKCLANNAGKNVQKVLGKCAGGVA
jgi:hypothetical protein